LFNNDDDDEDEAFQVKKKPDVKPLAMPVIAPKPVLPPPPIA